MPFLNYLADFLHEEMQKRNMSNHAFAEFIGVSHTTINRLVDVEHKDNNYPSIEFLIKLSRATKVNIRDLITLVAPEDTYTDTVEPPRFMPLSERLERLPERYRQVIEMIADLGLNETED
jgi:transcriptional regulator with XRE-family HTH domain